jgi:hypothetical protein
MILAIRNSALYLKDQQKLFIAGKSLQGPLHLYLPESEMEVYPNRDR